MYFFAGIFPGLRSIAILVYTEIKSRITGNKSYSSTSSPDGRFGLRSQRSQPIVSNGMDKSWTPSQTHYNHRTSIGDGIALVEYRQNIIGGRSKESDLEETRIEPGITRTQEVIITRETV